MDQVPLPSNNQYGNNAPYDNQQYNPGNEPQEPKKNNTVKKIIIAFIIVATVIGTLAVGGFYLVYKNVTSMLGSNSPLVKENSIASFPPTPKPTIDPNLDSDNDGIPDAVEKAIGTNPNKMDSDGDSYNDLPEIKSGYNPLVPGVTGKYTPEQLQTLKDKIKAADEKFYEKIFGTITINSNFSCGTSTVTDIDNNTYNTVQIGSQCWLKQNLKVTKNPQGKPITRYCYNNDNKICNTDGGLYDWNTAMNNSTNEGAQGICPNDWHVPKDSEWYELENYLKNPDQTCDSMRKGSDCDGAGAKIGIGGASGFDGILTGTINTATKSVLRGNFTNFWSSSEIESKAWVRILYSSESMINRGILDKIHGFSLRCLKD